MLRGDFLNCKWLAENKMTWGETCLPEFKSWTRHMCMYSFGFIPWLPTTRCHHVSGIHHVSPTTRCLMISSFSRSATCAYRNRMHVITFTAWVYACVHVSVCVFLNREYLFVFLRRDIHFRYMNILWSTHRCLCAKAISHLLRDIGHALYAPQHGPSPNSRWKDFVSCDIFSGIQVFFGILGFSGMFSPFSVLYFIISFLLFSLFPFLFIYFLFSSFSISGSMFLFL